MVSKAFLLLGLSIAIVLLITSQVAAIDVPDDKTNSEAATSVNNAKYGGGNGGYPGGSYGRNPGGGYGRGDQGGYGRGYCRYGCCRSGYGRDCRRCCNYAGEAMDVETAAKPHN
ncbi:hypothetical protein LguiB_029862 [Lonicera macranthoides]